MVKAQASVEIERSPESVYRFIAEDFERNYPRWSPEVQMLHFRTSGPLRVGSVARQVRIDQGRRSESVFRVTRMEHARRLTCEGRPPGYRVDYQILPQAGGCSRLTFSFELERLSLVMRPFERAIRHAVQDGARRTVRNLKRLIEAEQGLAAASTTTR